MVPLLTQDPSIGLYSQTDWTQSGVIHNTFFDGIGEIVAGRSPLARLDELLQAWRCCRW